jgi:hypothetical protein
LEPRANYVLEWAAATSLVGPATGGHPESEAEHTNPVEQSEVKMDSREYLQRQFASVRSVSDAVTRDLTDGQLNWAPPGTANPIGTTLVHTIVGEDFFVQSVIQGKPKVWDAGRWSERIGLKTLPGRGTSWEEPNRTKFSLADLLAYQEEVRSATDAYVAGLTAEELQRQVTFGGMNRSVAEALALSVTHTAHHMGEISILKGVQGAKGLPF